MDVPENSFPINDRINFALILIFSNFKTNVLDFGKILPKLKKEVDDFKLRESGLSKDRESEFMMH
uniref:Uncharacterized protein n=1 Tax=Romanomermis culicivorax TaxID=13658 RepID=A0A915JJJ1_ROMCU